MEKGFKLDDSGEDLFLHPRTEEEYENLARAGKDAVDEYEAEQVSASLIKHHDAIEVFFGSDTEADWVMIGDSSGTVIDSGKDDALFTVTQVKEIEANVGEDVIVFGRPITIEPTHPDPSVPPSR